jgi:UDP-N-acetylmuramoyl-tripeptide--D-alanyl-D-alanine ligase
VGELARMIHRASVREGQEPQDAVDYDEIDDALEDLCGWLRPGDVVLIKGSRVVGLERLAEELR